MKFKTLSIQNFMSIRSAEIKLDNQGLVLIKGINNSNPTFKSNGAGKSTIAESIVYVLFGRTIRGLKGDEVVNNVAKANCKVILDLVDDDGTEYRISRYRKHKENKNNVFLYCNGKDITPKSDADFTKAVVDLLQTDFMTFTSSILYSAESFKFTQATDSELKSAFDVMLDLKVYSDALEEVKSQLRELGYKKSEITSKVDSLNDKKHILQESKENAIERSSQYKNMQESKINTLEEEIKELQELKVDAVDTLSELNKNKDKLNEELENLKTKQVSTKKFDEAISQLNEVIEESENDKDDCVSKRRKFKLAIEDLKDDINRAKSKGNKNALKVESYENKMVELKETVGTPCPVCGKPLDEDHIEDAYNECLSEIDKLKKESEQLDNDIKGWEDDITKNESEIDEVNKLLEKIQSDLDGYNVLLEKAKKKLKVSQEAQSVVLQKEREIVKAEREIGEFELKVSSIDNKVDSKSQKIEEIENEKNPFIEQIEEFTTQIDSVEKKIEETSEVMNELKSEEEVLNFWLKGFSNSGIKSMLLDDITPFLNKRANKYLKVLSGGRLVVNFTTQTKLKTGEMREKFQIELQNQDGGSSYLSNSSGERRRVDVAVNLALCDLISSRANKKINLLFADEVFDSLDSCGVESVMNLLRELEKEKSSIFVISHNEEIQSFFDKVLTVKKDGESSVVEFEG